MKGLGFEGTGGGGGVQGLGFEDVGFWGFRGDTRGYGASVFLGGGCDSSCLIESLQARPSSFLGHLGDLEKGFGLSFPHLTSCLGCSPFNEQSLVGSIIGGTIIPYKGGTS